MAYVSKKFETMVRNHDLVNFNKNLSESYYSGLHPELKFLFDMPIEKQYEYIDRAIEEYQAANNESVFSVPSFMVIDWVRKNRKNKKESKNCPLTSKAVMDIFMDCLFKEQPAIGTKYIPSRGISVNVGFDPEKIESHKDEIINLLKFLPTEFFETDQEQIITHKKCEGGGWSLLKAPFTKYDTQWGEQIDADRLFMLGMAIGKVKYLMPREFWSALPGGVPYYIILNKCEKIEMLTVGS